MQLENQCCDYEITIFHFYHFGLVITEKQFFPQRWDSFHQPYPRGTSTLEILCVNISKNHSWNNMQVVLPCRSCWAPSKKWTLHSWPPGQAFKTVFQLVSLPPVCLSRIIYLACKHDSVTCQFSLSSFDL